MLTAVNIAIEEKATSPLVAVFPVEPAARIEALGQLIAAYNDATARLQHSHEQLTRTVDSLRSQLVEKDRQLERRNRLAALGEMAAGLAHEIRNPLGGIQLYTSMLARDLADRPQAATTVTKIAAGVKRLDGLVNQVLQFTREIIAHPAGCDLADIIAQAVDLAEPAMQSRGVTCRTIGPAAMPAIADAKLLGQAVLNLLLNAVEATPAGGSIVVSFGPTQAAGRRFTVAVADTGAGIDPAILDRLFNPFFTTKDTGTGLGLAIVHRIVEAHDGSISVANVAGGGARFEMLI